MQLEEAVKNQIEKLVKDHKVTLFMKGNKSFPQCGFSATVVGILKEMAVDFHAVNVLADPSIREGIKVYSDWPTIPQLYVDGQFVGGCDIVREMHASGELAGVLGAKVEAPKVPALTLTDAAAKAFKEAAEPGDDVLRLEVDARFAVDLYFGPKKPNDLVATTNGVAIHVDPASARRADGMSIDYVDGPSGAGFKIDNPNAPASVKQIGPKDLASMLKGPEQVHLIDVRTDQERDIAKIEGALQLDGEGRAALEKLDKNALVVFYCHHGVRSLAAADHYLKQGFKRVYNLAGGIDAWSTEVDAKVARY